MLEFDFTYSPWFILICALIAGLMAWVMYRNMGEVLPKGVKWFLTALRFITFLILGILLLEPLLNSYSKIKSPAIIAVLQDNSESLVINKDSAFARNEYPALLNNFLRSLESEDTETAFFTFASEYSDNVSPDSLSFDQSGTNISGALKNIGKLYKNQNLGAVVLISDGISTSGINPLYALEDFKQPVYTALLGDTTEQKDIKISEVLYNEIAYLDNETPIKVKVHTTGFESANLVIALQKDGKTLGTEQVQVSPDKLNFDVDFVVKPEQTGIARYSVHITEMKGEITYRNNHKSVFINVLETRIKLAIFAGAPHPDLGALHEALKRDERYEVIDFTRKSSTAWYESPSKYNFSDFDLVLLHNFPSGPQDQPTVDKIIGEVTRRQLPLMVFFGLHTDLEAAKPLFDHVAITPTVANRGAEEAQANFLPEYEDHSTFTFDRRWLQMMNAAPPLLRNRSDWRSKGDAQIFATATIKGITLEYPVFALQNHLGRKNMTMIGEGFWRMRSHTFMETKAFDDFDTWLFNTIQWLMVTEDKRKFKVRPSKYLFTGNELITFKGQAYDDSYNPIPGAEIKISLKNPDGKENVYYMNESGEARYYLELSNLGEGTYTYTAEGKKDEAVIGTDRGQFSLGKSNIEHFRLRADKNLMQQVALRTGGEFVFGRDIEQLSAQIKSLDTLKPVVDFKKKRLSFTDIYWILVIVVALLAVEWITRKIFSLI